MNPLMEKYFFGELTDSEEAKLEELLVGSEESAWEFGQGAEEAYKRYGLPEPELPGEAPGNGALPENKGNLKPWLWLFGFVTLLFVLFYGWWTHRGVETLVKPLEKQVIPREPITKKVVKSKTRQLPKQAPPVMAAPTPTSIWATPPSGSPEKVSGNDLKVIVHRETPGPVVVRVLDPVGMEIRRLYAGTLAAGRWGFEWDGRGANGQLVVPGNYKIEVDTDGMAQSREVSIH